MLWNQLPSTSNALYGLCDLHNFTDWYALLRSTKVPASNLRIFIKASEHTSLVSSVGSASIHLLKLLCQINQRTTHSSSLIRTRLQIYKSSTTVCPLKPKSGDKQYLLTTICRSTKFMVVKALSDIRASKIKSSLEGIFQEHSFPRSIILDNFPTFRSKQFIEFAERHGIESRSTPVYAGLARAYGIVSLIRNLF